MKTVLTAVVFLSLLAVVVWLSWPYLAPYIERGKQADLVKVREFNPLP